jgi:hypothetical protein
MRREEMIARSWKPYMAIEYKNARMEYAVECLLISVHFDDEIFELQPLDQEEYVQQTFFTSIENCHVPKKKMKAAYVDGKKVKGPQINPLHKKILR